MGLLRLVYNANLALILSESAWRSVPASSESGIAGLLSVIADSVRLAIELMPSFWHAREPAFGAPHLPRFVDAPRPVSLQWRASASTVLATASLLAQRSGIVRQ